ncbi:MAG: DUF975 family protein [Clostridia bacterium]|nr:DUF975 family protein [Clostridia bacterium]
MLTRKELKQNAWQELSGKWGKAAGVTLGYMGIWLAMILVVELIDALSGVSILGSIIVLILIVVCLIPLAFVMPTGYEWIFLKLHRGETTYFGDIFLPFAQVGKILVIAICIWIMKLPFPVLQELVRSVHINKMIVWILTIGASVAVAYISLTFILINYIMYDQKELGIIATMKRSTELMKGQKWNCYILLLSFFFWYLLVLVTCGIAVLWVAPYVKTTMANFYDELLWQEQQAQEQQAGMSSGTWEY